MNEKFTFPVCETIIFENEDVFTLSLGGNDALLPDINGVGE